MARSSACRTLSQNPSLSGKDKLAGAAPTKSNNISGVSYALTPAIALSVFFILSSMAQYLEDDLQRIFKTVLDSRTPAFPLALAPQQYKNPCERSLKAQFPEIYWSKIHLECYNFFQQSGNHFAIAGAKSQNRMLFAATFLKNTALFCWQQYQQKVEDETDIFITWEKFKAFFCQSLMSPKLLSIASGVLFEKTPSIS